MTQWERHRKLVIETYDTVIGDEVNNPIQLINSTLQMLNDERANIAEMSLLYSLKSDLLFENGLFEESYKSAMNGYHLDSERKEVLESLINIHNKFEDDEKAKEYAIKLEELYSSDPSALFTCSQCYSRLGLYDDTLRVLKQSFFKINKKNNNNQFLREIKSAITQTYIDRYSNCNNDSHELIIKYLIELIEWKYNNLNESNLKTCIEEIWERIDYILGTYIDNNINDNNWDKIWKLLCFIPCSIPLSIKLINLCYDIFYLYNKYQFGIKFFTRLITEYQTFNDNELSIHARFENYSSLYLNRAKLYKLLNCHNELIEDIDEINTRMIIDNDYIDDNDHQQVTINNVLLYNKLTNPNEKPLIETIQSIKKRRASRLSNITISPMPKQYRDLHLTPTILPKRKRFLSNQSIESTVSSLNLFDENKAESEEEFYRLENKNRLLENSIIDLKNDLYRESSQTNKYKQEIDKLKKEIIKLNDERNTCSTKDGETPTPGQYDENRYIEDIIRLQSDITKRDSLITTLKLENQQYLDKISKLKLEITKLKIIKDCEIKNAGNNGFNDKNVKIFKPQRAKKQSSSKSVFCCGKFIKFIFYLLIFIFLIMIIYDKMVSMDIINDYFGVNQQFQEIINVCLSCKNYNDLFFF